MYEKDNLYIGLCLHDGLTSCADTFLDLEPLDSRTDAVYFKKPEHFREFANGFYGQLLGWRSGIMEHMDLQSDLVNSRNGNQAYLDMVH